MHARSQQSQQRPLWRNLMVPGLIATALIVGLRLLGGFQFLEWKLLDTMLRLRPAEPSDQRITLVAINEADIQKDTYPISDARLAHLIQALRAYQPRVMGLDIFRDRSVPPGTSDFQQILAATPNLIGIERQILASPVDAPAALSAEQVGFVDVPLDTDGFLRRDLLGASDSQGNYRFSLTIQLLIHYLTPAGLTLENGIQDPVAMRFGPVELHRFHPNTGGYIRADAGGNQILVNPRSGQRPFQTVSMGDVLAGQVPPEFLRDRLVLIGVTAPSIKDVVNSGAIMGVNPGLVTGVEFRAHAVSQILSAALDGRPLLRTWSDPFEYGWIMLWGLAGFGLSHWMRSPRQQLLAVGVGGLGLGVAGYGLLLDGLWLPVIPAGLVFLFNSTVLYIFYLYDQGLRNRIQDRQQVIEQTFDAIHNGPLQSLAQIIRRTQTDRHQPDWVGPQLHNDLHDDLQALNQELRQVYEQMRQESTTQGIRLYLDHRQSIDTNMPLHELLYGVYAATLERNFPGFQTLKCKIVTFEPLAENNLNLEAKRDLARFLEEALCNCGKYALGATRLTVVCRQAGEHNLIQVTDNGLAKERTDPFSHGPDSPQSPGGRGTQQALRLARQLGGRFERSPVAPKGMSCGLSWPVQRSRWPALAGSRWIFSVQRLVRFRQRR